KWLTFWTWAVGMIWPGAKVISCTSDNAAHADIARTKIETTQSRRENMRGVRPSSNIKGCVSCCIGSDRMRLARSMLARPLGMGADMGTTCLGRETTPYE